MIRFVLALLIIASSQPVIASDDLSSEPQSTFRQDLCDDPPNEIVAENCSEGTSDWIVDNILNDIEGFAYPPSVNKGEALDLFINTSAEKFDLLIYRNGYYNNTGGRLHLSVPDVVGKEQPACEHDFETGLTSCSNWSSTYRLEVPETWVSGLYMAKFVRPDTGGENYALFMVRDDERDSEILFQQSLFTNHAYNNYGGKSVYTINSDQCHTVADAPRAVKVSLYRPPNVTLDSEAYNNTYRDEYVMLRWMEQQGYDVSYATNWDVHHWGQPNAENELLDHRVFLSVGHDEYWSQGMRDAVTAARDAGVHLGFFSANTSYWRIRLEADPWSDEQDSVMVTYKTTEGGVDDPSGHPTGTWRDPEGANFPENNLLGLQYIGDNDDFFFSLRITPEFGIDRIYRHTDLQTMPPNTYINIGDQIIGWEWDAVVDNGLTPAGVEILAETPVFGFLLQDAGNSANGTTGLATINMTRYEAPSGAIVFASGTIQWAWGLGGHGVEVVDPDPYIQQITYNILADMGVQPQTPVDPIILDSEEGLISSPPEAFRPIDSPAPIISNIQVDTSEGGLTSKGRIVTISWETDTDTKGQFWFGKENVIERGGNFLDFTRTYSVTFDYLDPNTTYHYRIMAIDEYGQIGFTEELTFKTPGNLLMQIALPLRREARSQKQAVECWSEANPTLAKLAGGGIGTASVLLAGFLSYRFYRRRKRRKAEATV